MRLTILTPCSRPENITRILHSVPDWAKWHICFDDEGGSAFEGLHYHKQAGSVSGNAQRNYLLDNVNADFDYVLFLDDDTVYHPKLTEIVFEAEADIVFFDQVFKDGKTRLKGTASPKVGKVDSGNFIVKREAIGGTRWQLDKYEADGLFVEDLLSKGLTVQVINKPGSYYNFLR